MSNSTFYEKLSTGDSVYEEHDNSTLPSYGAGIVERIFSTGHFLVKYNNRVLPIMHSSSGIRYDKEGKLGSRRIKTAEEHEVSSCLFGGV